MKFIIKHEIKGRIRISLARKFHTVREADVLEQYLLGLDGVTAAKVYERTADAVIYYKEDREAVLVQVAAFDGQITEKQEMAVKSSGRALNQEYKEKLIQKVLTRFVTKTFLPAPVRAVYTSVQAIRYIVKGIHCLVFKRKLHVEVLDATAISVSLLRRDFNTAGSVMFLLGIGELLEEWTHKKSVGDLARSMSLNVEKVWKKVDGTEVLVPLSDVTAGDELTIFGDHPIITKETFLKAAGWRRSERRGDDQPGFDDRRIPAGQKRAGQLCLRRNRAGRGRDYLQGRKIRRLHPL